MSRIIRYQGAIVRDDHLLLIQHREHQSGRAYWVLPGGGMEAEETPEACVQREMKEETHLNVQVLRLLREDSDMPGGFYQSLHTYLCHVIEGEAQPGHEPELDAAQVYAITDVQWCDLRNPAAWGIQPQSDPFTYGLVQRIQESLGYREAPSGRELTEVPILADKTD